MTQEDAFWDKYIEDLRKLNPDISNVVTRETHPIIWPPGTSIVNEPNTLIKDTPSKSWKASMDDIEKWNPEWYKDDPETVEKFKDFIKEEDIPDDQKDEWEEGITYKPEGISIYIYKDIFIELKSCLKNNMNS